MIHQLLQVGVTNFNLTILLSGKNVQPVADYINQTNRFLELNYSHMASS
jgi:hypothetical protein